MTDRERVASTSILVDAIVAADGDGSTVDAADLGGIGLAHGHAVQLQVLLRHLAAGDTLAGWKVGMTSGGNRNGMGDGVRPFGFLRGSRRVESGAELPLAAIPGAGIEPELGFVFARPLGGTEVTRDDVMAALGGVVPCFELNQRRVVGAASDGLKVAAGLSQWGVVTGAPTPWQGSAAEIVVRLEAGGTQVAESGPDYAIDDPIESIRALCARLARYGYGLLPGQVVITGAFAKARVEQPGEWTAVFSGLGGVCVRFV